LEHWWVWQGWSLPGQIVRYFHFMKTRISPLFRASILASSVALLLLPAAPSVFGAAVEGGPVDSLWLQMPNNANWNDGSNWDTGKVPNASDATANFKLSTITSVFLNDDTSVGQIIFGDGPGGVGIQPTIVPLGEEVPPVLSNSYTITTGSNYLDFYGAGIVNNTLQIQTIINGGVDLDPVMTFHNASSAGNAHLINTDFSEIDFIDTSSAGTATIINQGINSAVYFGSEENTGDSPTAANSTIINQGDGSAVIFANNASGGKATIINVSPTSYIDISGLTGSGTTLGAIAGVGTVYLGSKNLTVGGNNMSTVFSGVITDGSPQVQEERIVGDFSPQEISNIPQQTGGSLTKEGTGTLVLAGANTYTGNTIVNGGILSITGSIMSPNTYVNTGGTLYVDGSIAGNAILNGGMLGGNGMIGGSLVNNGMVSPGHSPGTLTINGNYTQGGGGTLIIQIASHAVFDHVNVGGSANLGGTLVVQALPGFKPKIGQSFQFLTAAGGVSGNFSNFVLPSTGTILKFGVNYETNSVLLETEVGSFSDTLQGLTPNEQAVANQLDKIANDKDAAKLIKYLSHVPLNQLAADLDLISGEELASVFTLGTSLDNIQALNLLRRNDDIRSGSNGFSASGFHTTGGGPIYSGGLGQTGPNGNDGKESKEVKNVVAPQENRWGTFITGVGEWVGVGDDFNARGYDIETGGFTLGVDYKVCEHFAIGLMAGYVGTDVDLSDGGRIRVNGGKAGIYGTAFGDGLYADFAVTGGYSSYDTHRAALVGTAHGDTDGGDLNVLFGVGYDLKAGGFSFGPTATFNYTYVGISSFNESGSLAPLHMTSQGQDSLRTAFGFKASYEAKLGSLVFKPEIRAAWQHEYGDVSNSLDSGLSSGAGDVFTVTGPKIGRDSALIGAGFAIQLSERASTYVYYDGELGRTRFDSHSVSGGFRISF
jgi:outer membrane autotransporter protein